MRKERDRGKIYVSMIVLLLWNRSGGGVYVNGWVSGLGGLVAFKPILESLHCVYVFMCVFMSIHPSIL